MPNVGRASENGKNLTEIIASIKIRDRACETCDTRVRFFISDLSMLFDTHTVYYS